MGGCGEIYRRLADDEARRFGGQFLEAAPPGVGDLTPGVAGCRGGLGSAFLQEWSRPRNWRGNGRWRYRRGPPSRQPRVGWEEHTSELQSQMRISYAVFFLNKNKK